MTNTVKMDTDFKEQDTVADQSDSPIVSHVGTIPVSSSSRGGYASPPR